MAIYRPVGKRLARKEELADRIARGESRAVAEELGTPLDIRRGSTRPFKEIGLNKPLLIEVRHVYTGQHPYNVIGPVLAANDLLVTSTVRSLATFNAKPKAVNFVKADVKQFSNIRNPAAGEDGTPVMFYVPALTEANSILDLELIFNRFNPALLEGIGNVFTAAAGIPIFVVHSTYLLAAGALTKLAARVAERLFDGSPAFSQTEEISFLRGGAGIPQEGYHLITEDDFDPEREGCEFDLEKGRLLKDDKEYKGPHPYVVISLDGEEHKEYNSFVPAAVSAALLGKFYHLGEGEEQPIDMLMEAVKLYNDWQNKRSAEGIDAQLAGKDPKSDQYKKLVEKRDAYLANLITDVFKA